MAYPNGRTVRRAIEHKCRKVSEVRMVNQLLYVVGECNSHRASFAQIVRSVFARLAGATASNSYSLPCQEALAKRRIYRRQ